MTEHPCPIEKFSLLWWSKYSDFSSSSSWSNPTSSKFWKIALPSKSSTLKFDWKNNFSKEYFFSNLFSLTIAMVKYLTSSAILDGLTVTDAFNPIASPLSLEKKRSKNLLSFNP